MAMSVGPADDDDIPMSDINTTPLVDVMLVLLIIFLITVPVVIQTVPLQLPKVSSTPTQTKPENVLISVNSSGDIFWGLQKMESKQQLLDQAVSYLRAVKQRPQHAGKAAVKNDKRSGRERGG